MSPDPYFNFVFLFMEGNSATFQNILILLGSIIEEANMDCNMQEWQLYWSLFSCYVPWFIFLTSYLACFWVTIWNKLMILCRIIQQVNTKCLMLEWRLFLLIFLIISPGPFFYCCSCSKTWFSWNFQVSCLLSKLPCWEGSDLESQYWFMTINQIIPNYHQILSLCLCLSLSLSLSLAYIFYRHVYTYF